MIIIAAVPTIASTYIPYPHRHPIAAAHQTVAAVVKPLTVSPCLKIIPAPKKPIPDTTCAMIRELSPLKIEGDISTNNVLPSVISDIVRVPTTLPCYSRSKPIKYPNTNAKATFASSVSQSVCKIVSIISIYLSILQFINH